MSDQPLTASERAELDQLRKDAQQSAQDASGQPQDEAQDTHWLHLADGTVVTGNGNPGSVNGVPVIGAYEIPV